MIWNGGQDAADWQGPLVAVSALRRRLRCLEPSAQIAPVLAEDKPTGFT